MKLNNKIAIITGAGNGIGRGVAIAAAREGAKIAICDLDQNGLETTAQLAREYNEVFLSRINVCDGEAIASFVKSAYAHFGQIDVLVNVAGIMPVVNNEEIDEAVVDDILAVNLKAPIMFTKYVIPLMKKSDGGAIIHMASVTGHNGHPGITVYGATKGGLMALARGQAMELAKDRIRVNTVSPGTVDSPMLHRFLDVAAEDKEKARAGFDAIHPRGKIATVDEIASVYSYTRVAVIPCYTRHMNDCPPIRFLH